MILKLVLLIPLGLALLVIAVICIYTAIIITIEMKKDAKNGGMDSFEKELLHKLRDPLALYSQHNIRN